MAGVRVLLSGWPISEAIDKLVPRSDLKAWRAAEQTLEALPSSSGSSFLDGGLRDGAAADDSLRDRRDVAQRAVKEARERVLRLLKDLGFRGCIVGMGRPDRDSAPPEIIPQDRWLGFSEFNEERSVVTHGNDGFLSVVVYPVLASPRAGEAIAGKQLSDILHYFVLHDPEIEVLCEAVHPAPAALSDLIGRSGDGGYLVPVSESAREIERALHSVPLEAVRPVLASRLAALGRLLLGGNLALTGFHDGNAAEEEVEVSASELRKPSMRLCLATGDLCRADDGEKRRLYHLVRIEMPEARAMEAAGRQAADPNAAQKSNRGGAPAADYEGALATVLRSVFLHQAGSKISRTQDLISQVAEVLKKRGQPRGDETIGKTLKGDYPLIWRASKGDESGSAE